MASGFGSGAIFLSEMRKSIVNGVDNNLVVIEPLAGTGCAAERLDDVFHLVRWGD